MIRRIRDLISSKSNRLEDVFLATEQASKSWMEGVLIVKMKKMWCLREIYLKRFETLRHEILPL